MNSHQMTDQIPAGKIYFLLIADSKKILCEFSKNRTIYDCYTKNILNCLKPGRLIHPYKSVEYVMINQVNDKLTF
jgi:hypothetical protein